MTKIIRRQTRLPTSNYEMFSTVADGQTSLEINVLQGEREFVRDNKSLGSYCLNGIPPAPCGVPQIEVEFVIDENGILSVEAIDGGSGEKLDITVTGASTLPRDEVESMVMEAERFAGEDNEKNQAGSVIYDRQKKLSELREKIEASRMKMRDKHGELKETLLAIDSDI
ncbi:hypothetical protein MKW92_021674 [Papaver armeniacum]|nr:hypothetical protein MKW92_021674 [Papaver armeniacum]